MSRRIPASAFALAALAFLLPFGSVSSCEGEAVSFTGVELATFRVAPDASNSGPTLHEEVERNAGTIALVVLLTALAGLGLDLFRRAGGGVCAIVGLAAMQVAAAAIVATGEGGGSVEAGYLLALLGFSLAALLHLRLALRRRRESGAPRWTYAIPRIALAFLPTLTLVAFVLVAAASEPTY